MKWSLLLTRPNGDYVHETSLTREELEREFLEVLEDMERGLVVSAYLCVTKAGMEHLRKQLTVKAH